jgi:uncharacterized protein (UPF0303 family)
MCALDEDIARLVEQERRLQLARFDLDQAFALGCALRQRALSQGLALVIELRLARRTVFHVAMPGSRPVNDDWVRRKRTTVELHEQSSYLVGRQLEREGSSLEAKLGIVTREAAAFGGGFPIRVAGVGCIGCVTVSGAPQRLDHALVVEALAAQCGVPLHEVALAPG